MISGNMFYNENTALTYTGTVFFIIFVLPLTTGAFTVLCDTP